MSFAREFAEFEKWWNSRWIDGPSLTTLIQWERWKKIKRLERLILDLSGRHDLTDKEVARLQKAEEELDKVK